MAERSRQYETNVKVGTLQQKLNFQKGANPAACGKYFTTSYIPRASDAAVLSKNLDQLTSLKTEVNKLKNEVVAMDQGLFDKSGRRLSPGKSIHHDFNSATVNKLNELGQNASAFMAQVDEKLKELQSTFKGLVFKPSTSKDRKRKQNKRKGIKRKLARMENAKTKESCKRPVYQESAMTTLT